MTIVMKAYARVKEFQRLQFDIVQKITMKNQSRTNIEVYSCPKLAGIRPVSSLKFLNPSIKEQQL